MLKSLQEILRGDAEHALHRLWSDQLTASERAAIQNRVQGEPKYRDEFKGTTCHFGFDGRIGERSRD